MPFLTYTTLFERSKRGIEKSMKNLSKQRSKQPVTNGEKNIDPSSVKTKRGHYITKFTNPNNALLYKGKSFKMTIHFQGVSSTPKKNVGCVAIHGPLVQPTKLRNHQRPIQTTPYLHAWRISPRIWGGGLVGSQLLGPGRPKICSKKWCIVKWCFF